MIRKGKRRKRKEKGNKTSHIDEKANGPGSAWLKRVLGGGPPRLKRQAHKSNFARENTETIKGGEEGGGSYRRRGESGR